jgi:hypothetical protein
MTKATLHCGNPFTAFLAGDYNREETEESLIRFLSNSAELSCPVIADLTSVTSINSGFLHAVTTTWPNISKGKKLILIGTRKNIALRGLRAMAVALSSCGVFFTETWEEAIKLCLKN